MLEQVRKWKEDVQYYGKIRDHETGMDIEEQNRHTIGIKIEKNRYVYPALPESKPTVQYQHKKNMDEPMMFKGISTMS